LPRDLPVRYLIYADFFEARTTGDSQQLAAAQARVDGLPGPALSIEFEHELEDMFTGPGNFVFAI
jgi:hypothetical protein